MVFAKLDIYKEDVASTIAHRSWIFNLASLESKMKIDVHEIDVLLKDLQQQHIIREFCLLDHQNLKHLYEEGGIALI